MYSSVPNRPNKRVVRTYFMRYCPIRHWVLLPYAQRNGALWNTRKLPRTSFFLPWAVPCCIRNDSKTVKRTWSRERAHAGSFYLHASSIKFLIYAACYLNPVRRVLLAAFVGKYIPGVSINRDAFPSADSLVEMFIDLIFITPPRPLPLSLFLIYHRWYK